MIKALKIGNSVISNFREKTTDEDGKAVWNIPISLDDFKSMALDTINWQAGRSVLIIADTKVGLSTMNAKSMAVMCKLMAPTKAKLDTLTENERKAWGIIEALATNGYGDSEKLVSGLKAVMEAVAKATDKSMRVMQATTHETVIEILNED